MRLNARFDLRACPEIKEGADTAATQASDDAQSGAYNKVHTSATNRTEMREDISDQIESGHGTGESMQCLSQTALPLPLAARLAAAASSSSSASPSTV